MHTKFSVSLRCGVTTDWEPWLPAGSIPTTNHMGPSSGLKTKMRSTLIGIQWRERSSHRPQCARVGGTISTGGNKKRLHGVIGELEVDESEQPGKKQRRTMASASAAVSAAVALPAAPAALGAESMGMEAVVDESVVKQESLVEMMVPTAAPPAVPVCDAL